MLNHFILGRLVYLYSWVVSIYFDSILVCILLELDSKRFFWRHLEELRFDKVWSRGRQKNLLFSVILFSCGRKKIFWENFSQQKFFKSFSEKNPSFSEFFWDSKEQESFDTIFLRAISSRGENFRRPLVTRAWCEVQTWLKLNLVLNSLPFWSVFLIWRC